MIDIYILFPTVGLYYCFNNLSDARIFIIMYGVTSMYFSAVMVCHAKSYMRTLQKDVSFWGLSHFQQCQQKMECPQY